ncbi:P-loop NTPase [Thermosulfuriphilus ammonigenes]|uniref:Iron-sulfur cluster carrier protein n=1 Tax=Thermosulfuriphilus ammonigenes TaxID=1936021 RepID=A0A6G7PT76_9BACT|nr:iron-sulfur cluster carrier protein MrpORP [Thermosulfuriphilus ammonigenes]MBA2849271.1 Mrp family chromosome partitioning ATPase/predicted Fe-Mo cluster-binding NifX family protein [Thermosulfuriphilus ammonigenes]QIJ70885.1 P-loop NTPase [Thermosulfuriphilus ammonigenes]
MAEEPKSAAGSLILEQQDKKIRERLARIENKLLVLSGKGGVGKSTVAINLAIGLSLQDFHVGLLDVDLHGPNVPKMLGLRKGKLQRRPDGSLGPIVYSPNLKFISIEPLLPREDAAVIWRGPMKISAIRQFIYDIDWGDLDYLVIDAPPGTGDEPMTVAKTIPDAYAVIVTTPQEVSLIDVKKSISFCRHVNMQILGVVENMSGFICPHCGKDVDLFKVGGGERLARELGIPFLGRIPVDPRVVAAGDAGKPMIAAYPESKTAEAFENLVRNVIAVTQQMNKDRQEGRIMRIAMPVDGPRLSEHFGQAPLFAFYNVEGGRVVAKEVLKPPPHEPGAIPRWLSEQGATHVIASHIGARAVELLKEAGIQVLPGAPKENADQVVESFLKGEFKGDESALCQHEEGRACTH